MNARPELGHRAAEVLLGVREDAELHRRSSATACAASPSRRPVKPRPSVVVARTATRSRFDPERVGKPRAHRVAMRREPRLLADQHDVGVLELPAGLAHAAPRLAQQLDRVRALERRVAGREERADVLHARCAEHGIGERMREHVAVGVA